jgi:hypothetical protein
MSKFKKHNSRTRGFSIQDYRVRCITFRILLTAETFVEIPLLRIARTKGEISNKRTMTYLYVNVLLNMHLAWKEQNALQHL